MSVMRSGQNSELIGYGNTDTVRAPLEQWADMESSYVNSVDDFGDAVNNTDREKVTSSREKASFDGANSDIGEYDQRRLGNDAVKVNYNSDSCLTPRSRRTLRRTVSTISEPWPSIEEPSKPTLDTIFSPTHEILHPLQSLRLERSFSAKPASRNKIITRSAIKSSSFRLPLPQTKSIEFDGCKSPKPQEASDEVGRFVSFNPRSDSAPLDPYRCAMVRSNNIKFQSYVSYHPKHYDKYQSFKTSSPQLNFAAFEGYAIHGQESTTTVTVEEEKLEQKQNLIDNPDYAHDDALPEAPNIKIHSDSETASVHGSKVVAIVVNAEKKLTFVALDWAINAVVEPGDEIIILGILKHIFSPMGFKLLANTDPLLGTDKEFLQASLTEATKLFEQKLAVSGRREECERKKIKLTVRIAPGACARSVVVQELAALEATYAVFDRKTMRNRRYYSKHLSCHAVRMRRNGRSTSAVTSNAHKHSPMCRLPILAISPKSTHRTCPQSPRPAFWRKFTNFKLRRRSRTITPQSSEITQMPGDISPSSRTQLHEARGIHSFKLKSFTLGMVACASCISDEAHPTRSNQGVISITIPTPICAS